MATFHIHQDAEKENSRMPKLLKDKTLGANVGIGNVKAKSLQASTLLGGGGAAIAGGGGVAAKHGRNASKVAFREVGNVKVHDENVATTTTAINAAANNATTATAVVGGHKKSTVVPVVEQFKTFSVYEDQKQHVIVGGAGQAITTTTTTTQAVLKQNIEIDKENVYQYQHTRVEVKRNVQKDDYGHDEHDNILDTTPMSVSEVLSPMSVDRSMVMPISESKTSADNDYVAHLLDDSSNAENKQPTREQMQKQLLLHKKPALPRNDRQRFFEVVEYQCAILEYFRESEQKHRPKPQYMRRQNDINYSMRTILVDWLVEVSEEYNLDTETLYLSISYIDRFLSQMSVVRSKLQLVGTAAMYIASKYEEIYPPDVSEFVFITDDTYNKAQVLRMEQIILKILAFDLCTPTAYVFINTYAVITDMDDMLKFLTQYICELSLLEGDPYLRFVPSLISASALALARHTLAMPIWTTELEEVTAYTLSDLREVVLHLCKSHNAASTLAQQAIQEKYKAEKYGNVSTVMPIDLNDADFDALVRDYTNSNDDTTTSTILNGRTTTTANSGCSSNEQVRRMISQMMN